MTLTPEEQAYVRSQGPYLTEKCEGDKRFSLKGEVSGQGRRIKE